MNSHQTNSKSVLRLSNYERTYDFLKVLTSVGGRLTGSPEAYRAVELMFNLMSDLGLDKVWKEPVRVNRWLRGKSEIALVRSQVAGDHRLNIWTLSNSQATPESGLEAGLVEVTSDERLAELKDSVRGRIVFFNVPMDRTLLEPFAAYGRAAQFRVKGASESAKKPGLSQEDQSGLSCLWTKNSAVAVAGLMLNLKPGARKNTFWLSNRIMEASFLLVWLWAVGKKS